MARVSERLVDIAVLLLGSWLGCALRMALQTFYEYDPMVVFPALYAQVVGCAAMAATVQHRQRLLKWYAPFVLATTTGFAGSLTTFSSWMGSATTAVMGLTSPTWSGGNKVRRAG